MRGVTSNSLLFSGLGAEAQIMSKPPDKQITEVGSRSAGDAVKAAEQNAEAY